MGSVNVHFYLSAAGIVSIIGLLLRLTWQSSRFVEALRHHVKESDEKFSDAFNRIRWLEQRRR